MALALGTTTIVLLALLCVLAWPKLAGVVAHERARRRRWHREDSPLAYDPGRERRAELRARALLRSCVDEQDWAMYRDLGFLRVWGGTRSAGGPAGAGEQAPAPAPGATCPSYAYLIYPHRPIVAYIPQTGALLSEYCVAFPDQSRPYGSSRLPDADDVLAKWMALMADERRLIAEANMHLPGRQIDPQRVRRDLRRLAHWEHEQRPDGPADIVRAA